MQEKIKLEYGFAVKQTYIQNNDTIIRLTTVIVIPLRRFQE
jgi:hypothetical protein